MTFIIKMNGVTNMPVYSRLKQDYINFFPAGNFFNVPLTYMKNLVPFSLKLTKI